MLKPSALVALVVKYFIMYSILIADLIKLGYDVSPVEAATYAIVFFATAIVSYLVLSYSASKKVGEVSGLVEIIVFVNLECVLGAYFKYYALACRGEGVVLETFIVYIAYTLVMAFFSCIAVIGYLVKYGKSRA